MSLGFLVCEMEEAFLPSSEGWFCMQWAQGSGKVASLWKQNVAFIREAESFLPPPPLSEAVVFMCATGQLNPLTPL